MPQLSPRRGEPGSHSQLNDQNPAGALEAFVKLTTGQRQKPASAFEPEEAAPSMPAGKRGRQYQPEGSWPAQEDRTTTT